MSHVGIVAMSEPALGGTFQYTLSMIDALRRIKKNKYTIFTSATNHSYDDLGLPIVRLPSAARTVVEILRTRLLPMNGGGIFSDMEKLIAPIYSTRLLASRQPFLFTLHDLQEKYYPENFSIAQRVWRNFVNRSLSRAAAGIICESNQVKSDIQRFLAVDQSKITVIAAPPATVFSPEHVDSPEFKVSASKVALPAQYLFYPAQFFPHKNHIRLVEAFALILKEFPDCRLLLTGQRKYDFTKVMSRVAELGIQDRVTHLGYVDTDMLAAVYLRATVVVVPTLFESISIPIYEAFRLGVPVCASNVVALPEQIGDAGVLFDPLSIEDMAGKISTVLGNAELQAELIQRGKNRVESLTPERYAAQLDIVVDNLGRRNPDT
jgi:glycosyltransferase involved in cell wall biosynthesis